jgi:hypothetical protein
LQTLALPLGYATEDTRFTCKPLGCQRLPPERLAHPRAVGTVENALTSTPTFFDFRREACIGIARSRASCANVA